MGQSLFVVEVVLRTRVQYLVILLNNVFSQDSNVDTSSTKV